MPARSKQLFSAVAGAAAALCFVWLLNHGVFVGSQTGVNAGGFFYKTCKYLFVSGIAELPAQGGLAAVVPTAPRGIELGDRGGQTLYCRLTAD